MWSNKLLSILLLAIAVAISLRSTVHVHTICPAKSQFYTSKFLIYNASATKQIVIQIEKFHARHFVDRRFTTEELAMHPEAKAAIEYLREPLQAVVALDSNTGLSDCKVITRPLETCAVWSISANIDPATARPFLHAINARVRRCVETLDKVMQQHSLLEQLMQRLTDGDKENVREILPLLFESEHEAPAQDFISRAFSLRNSAYILSWRLEEWKVKSSAVVESHSSNTRIRKFLAGKREKLATVAARDDVGFAQDLSVLLRNCREGHSSHWC